MFILIFFIVLFLLIISIIALYYLRSRKKNEQFKFRFPLVQGRSNLLPYTIFNTSLRALVLPRKTYTEYTPPNKLPKFLKYKRTILTPIGDQGLCGSCWAFAIAGVLADRLSIYTNRKYRHRLSAQSIISCVNYPKGCYGGELDKTANWLEVNQYPVPTENMFAYQNYESLEIDSTCRPKQDIKAGVVVKLGSVKSIVTYIDEFEYDKKILEENIKNMKQELFENGPFFAAISIYSDFLEYRGDTVYVKKSDSKFIGGHGIEVIGFCEKGEDFRPNFVNYAYWICKHNWGIDWPTPQSLYGPSTFCIRMGTNECGIESRCGILEPYIDKDEIVTIDYENNRTMSFSHYKDMIKIMN